MTEATGFRTEIPQQLKKGNHSYLEGRKVLGKRRVAWL